MHEHVSSELAGQSEVGQRNMEPETRGSVLRFRSTKALEEIGTVLPTG